MITRRTTALAVLLTAGLALAGCVTVFPKTKPVQLDRFGDHPVATATSGAGGTSFSVLAPDPTFTRAAEGDRILTVTGEETAYIADARWIAPAAVLFDEAEVRAFEAAGGPAPKLALRLSVENFEVDYPRTGPHIPTVNVRIHAVLIRSVDRQVVAEQTFVTRTPVRENRLAGIVGAFDSATNQALGQIVDWTNAKGGGD